MADFVSPIVDIISRLWPCCATHTRYLCKLQENKDLLRNVLKELTDARNDVQRRVYEAEIDPNGPKKRTDQVDGWLQRVRTIESEVEEILQKADEQLSRTRCLGACCSSKKCWSNYKLGKSIAKKIPLVDGLKGKGHFEEVTYNLPPPSVQDMDLESTVGMESMFDKVWRLITTSTATDDKVVRIMGLYGHGGVGKTALLKKINNEFKKICGEQDHVVIFVVVSKTINYEAIQKKIGERLGKDLKEDGDESSRADKIFNMLSNRNFVLLLDDIWERVDLQRIGIPSPSTPAQDNSSSKIVIFTTRNKEVCGRMEATHTFRVECLPCDKAWRLFQDKVGEEALTSFPRARELAELVAKECGGLPLALITIGRAMSARKSVKEWKDALRTLTNSASEFPGMSDEVLPRLKFSYDNLPNETIKSCFLYCALYPEDYRIKIDQLIDYWIGEGFLNEFEKNNLDEARSHGFTIIETLKRACLLEEESIIDNEYDEGTHVKMHDVIRDLARWIVNDCKSNNNNSKTIDKFLVVSNVCERWRNAERIFCMARRDDDVSNNELELEEPPKSPNLQTLMVSGEFSLPQSFFQFTPFLRVLDLSFAPITELPTSICELYDLQYLGLSATGIKELPVELRKLVKLKFLDLSDTFNLSKIPRGLIANLSDLQVLKLVDLGFKDLGLKEEKDGGGLSFGELDRLKQLQELEITINTPLALEKLLLCNQKLRMVCTKLCCLDIESISLPPPLSSSISEGGLVNLKCLRYFGISSSSIELEELTLFIINGATGGGLLKNKYQHALSPFQNLDTIRIQRCNALKDLTWLVYVENLKKLRVGFCKRLETIIELGDDDGLEGTAGGVFRSLEHLVMEHLPKLKSICRHALAFPFIRTIRITQCPGLKKLPLDSGCNVNNTLKWIKGSRKWWNELQWEDETIKSKFLPYYEEEYQQRLWLKALSPTTSPTPSITDLDSESHELPSAEQTKEIPTISSKVLKGKAQDYA